MFELHTEELIVVVFGETSASSPITSSELSIDTILHSTNNSYPVINT